MIDIGKQLHQCINPIYLKSERLFVNCGKCEYCRKLWLSDWATRLTMQRELSYLTICMTLTYNDENLPLKNGIPSLSKSDVQKFFKRLRKETTKLYPNVSYQYFISGEYGSSYLRPHYHLILYINGDNLTLTKYDIQTICLDKWKKGYINFQDTDAISIKYLAKYIGKTTGISDYAESNDLPLPFVLMSRRPAIGAKYLEINGGKNFEYHFKSLEHSNICLPSCGKFIIPRYIRKQVYQNYPKNVKHKFYQKLNDLKQEKYENKIRQRAKHFQSDCNNFSSNYSIYPDLENLRQQNRREQQAEHIAMINYLNSKK